MNKTLRSLLAVSAMAVLPVCAASSATLSTDKPGNPPSGAPASDTTPPAPAKFRDNTTPMNSANDVRRAPDGAPASDTRPPRPSKDSGNATPVNPASVPQAPSGAPDSYTPPPAPAR